MKLCHLQESVVTFDGMKQMQCFWHKIKAESITIQTVQLTCEKIDMMKFYIQIEFPYTNMNFKFEYQWYCVLSTPQYCTNCTNKERKIYAACIKGKIEYILGFGFVLVIIGVAQADIIVYPCTKEFFFFCLVWLLVIFILFHIFVVATVQQTLWKRLGT